MVDLGRGEEGSMGVGGDASGNVEDMEDYLKVSDEEIERDDPWNN